MVGKVDQQLFVLFGVGLEMCFKKQFELVEFELLVGVLTGELGARFQNVITIMVGGVLGSDMPGFLRSVQL